MKHMSRDFERELCDLSDHYRNVDGPVRETMRRWLGTPDAWTEESFHLAKEWIEKCQKVKPEECHSYANLPADDDISKLEGCDWTTIRDLKGLANIWDKAKENGLDRQVRRMARPESEPAFTENEWRELEAFGSEELRLLYKNSEGNRDLFPLFKAYVYYHWPLASWRQHLRWAEKDLGIPIQNLSTAAKVKWTAWKESPRVLAFFAFACLAFAFLAFAWDSLLLLLFEVPAPAADGSIDGLWFLWYSPLYVPLLALAVVSWTRRPRHWATLAIALCVIVLIVGSILTVFGPLWPVSNFPDQTGKRNMLAFLVSATALFLSTFSIVWIRSISQSFGLLLPVILSSGVLLQSVLGFEPSFIARATAIMLFGLGALGFLHEAGSKVKPQEDNSGAQEDGSPPLVVFLREVTSGKKWKKPLESWHWPHGLLFSLLFLLALLLFFSFFGGEKGECSLGQARLQIMYPSWLSDRDHGTIYLSLTEPATATHSVHLQATDGSTVFVTGEETAIPGSVLSPAGQTCPTVAAPSSDCSAMSMQNLVTRHQHWEVQTLWPESHWALTGWQFSAWLMAGGALESPSAGDTDPCTFTITRLKVPFGLRGFLEVQPFVTLVGILYGVAQAMLQLWVGEKAWGDEGSDQNDKKAGT